MAGPRYTADPPGAMPTVELDGLTALFHVRSGMTHILAAPAPQILALLAEGPATRETILARLTDRFAVESEGDVLELLEARLSELENAGLVWRS